jgi:asparagine synthetase B (glutamine-hydrolysing)
VLRSVLQVEADPDRQVLTQVPSYFDPSRLQTDDWKTDPRLRDTYWPLTLTPYTEIDHLIPNHYLDVEAANQVRFWPSQKVDMRSAPDAYREAADLLTAAITQIAKLGFALKLPLTAGHDSRILFGACLNAGVDFRCYTYRLKSGGSVVHGIELDDDVRVATQIAQTYRVPHDIFDMSPDVSLSDVKPMLDAIDYQVPSPTLPFEFAALSSYSDEDDACLNGNASEIGGAHFGQMRPSRIDPLFLAALARRPSVPFVIQTYASWLGEATPVCESTDYRLMDLLYWEDRMGGWQASFQQAMTNTWSVLTPYNNRKLLETLLSVPLPKRSNRGMQKSLIDHLGGERLGSFPLNPSSRIRVAVRKAITGRMKKSALLNEFYIRRR